MDPLSIIAAVTGITTAVVKIANTLTDFISRERKAPDTARIVVAEVTSLRICLSQLLPFLHDMGTVPQSRRAAISVESIVVISTSCVLTISELEQTLDTFKLYQPLSRTLKLRWARQEHRINTLVSRVQESRTSLSLILTILTCETTVDIQGSVERLSASIGSILQNSEDISRRLASMEPSLKTRNDSVASSVPSITDADSTRTIKPSPGLYEQSVLLSSDNPKTGLDPGVQSEIHSSRVYVRTSKRHSISSIPSSIQSIGASSFYSGISLSQITNISVLSLPVFREKISNPQHYPILASDIEQASCKYWHREGPEREVLTNIRDAMTNPLDLRSEVRQQILTSSTSSKAPLLGGRDGKQPPSKTLLLGASGAGETTILKQMRLIYALDSFSSTDYEDVRPPIFENMVYAFRIIFEELPGLGLQYHDKSVEQMIYEATRLYCGRNQFEFDDCFDISAYLTPMKALWHDEVIITAVLRGGDFALHDNLGHCMRNFNRLFSKEYLPTNQDFLYASKRKIRVTEAQFYHNESFHRVYDVGGSRHERKRNWEQMMTDVDCLVFVAALGAFDSTLIEDRISTQIEAELIFQLVKRVSKFSNVPVFLFLNKSDLCDEKFRSKCHYVKAFYTDIAEARDYCAQPFCDMMQEQDKKNDLLHVYFTNATDTESLQGILEEIFEAAKQHAQGRISVAI